MNRPKLKSPRFIAYVQPGTSKEQSRKFFSIAAAQVYAVGHATRSLAPGHPVRWYIVDLRTSTKVIEGAVNNVEKLSHVSEPIASVMKGLTQETTTNAESKLLEALLRVARKSPKGALLQMKLVRAEAALSKQAFDDAAIHLQKQRRIVMHHHDFPSSVPKATLDQYVFDKSANRGEGIYYLGIAPVA